MRIRTELGCPVGIGTSDLLIEIRGWFGFTHCRNRDNKSSVLEGVGNASSFMTAKELLIHTPRIGIPSW